MFKFYSGLLRLFGMTTKAAPNAALITHLPTAANGWLGTIRESFAGSWQRNIEVNAESVLAYSAVWACVTLIANDISKLWVKVVERDSHGICTEVDSPAFSPVLRKPNHYQTRVKFFQGWILSLLTRGNTYILKERDGRGVVVGLYLLDPQRVQVLMAPDGTVYYALGADYLSGLTEASVTVPQREIIHDVCVPLFHPLCGLTPIYACGLAATQGLKIQSNSAQLFASGSHLSGVLTAPTPISPESAKAIQENWEAMYSGPDNVGKVAVFGDGVKFEPMTMTNVDAQLIEQLRWSAESVAACFHVPAFMIGAGPAPPYNNIQTLSQQYYQQALQHLIENMELLLTEGLALPRGMSVEFDLDALLRMDTLIQTEVLAKSVGAGFMAPNEARAKFDLKPVDGGDSPYLQQQNYSLRALNLRDSGDPFPAPPSPAPVPTVAPNDSSTRAVGHLTMKVRDLEAVLLELQANPKLKYCGSWRAGAQHTQDEAVTHRGGLFVCNGYASSEPGIDSIGWQVVGSAWPERRDS